MSNNGCMSAPVIPSGNSGHVAEHVGEQNCRPTVIPSGNSGRVAENAASKSAAQYVDQHKADWLA
eukprot:1521306-Prorocentrum_lima.AAC.1